MLAKGTFSPKEPYFFIQEYKQSYAIGNTEFQILAEMIAALEINKKNVMNGAFVEENDWFFITLEIEHLKQIYINLQAVKKLFC